MPDIKMNGLCLLYLGR
uniref:Uncharacterized protein n=1 Tax=Anguilla anguilla TaxID=7936 RepID=A0A0E9V4P8_ANGAN